jgi:plasmid stabilization system protein ParE
MDAIHKALELLERFHSRVARPARALGRELVIPFGHDGYVALFEIMDDRTVVVAAVRHQREDDYR